MTTTLSLMLDEILVPETLFVIGIGVAVVGFVVAAATRTRFAVQCQSAREMLKKEAQELGQEERFQKLVQEEKNIKKTPRIGTRLLILGIIMCVISAVLVFMK